MSYEYAGEPVELDSYLTSSQESVFLSKHENESICCNCKFWDKHEEPAVDGHATTVFERVVISYDGYCKRHSPVLVESDDMPPEFPWWPETCYCNWCGDFEHKQQNEVKNVD